MDMLVAAFWLAVGVISSTAWNLSLRSAMKGEKDEAAASTVSNFLTIVATVPFILVLGANFASNGNSGSGIPAIAWIACAAAAAFSLVFQYFTFRASKVVEASERAIVSRLNIFWALLFAALFLGEGISALKVAAVVLIFAASGLSVYKPGITKWKIDGLQLVIFAAAFSAALSIISKFGVGVMPPLIFALFESAFLTLGLYLLTCKASLSRCLAVWKRKPQDLLINGVAGAVFYVAMLVAFTMLPASIVVPIMATAVVLTAIAGGVLLGEKESWLRKILGAILALAGTILISMA